jgi:CxxC motif-containing protein (DUF1111 family)
MKALAAAGCLLLIVAAALAGGAGLAEAGEDDDPFGERAGGAGTVFATGRNAFSFPLTTLSDEEGARFAVGNSFFRRNWVEAPSSTRARDGLGPHFIARSCGGCHVQDGRGAPPGIVRGSNDEQPVALLLRLSVPSSGVHGGPAPEPVYGDQLNNAAVQGVKPEAQVQIKQRQLHGRFADGTAYTLRQPVYRFTELAYGSLAKGTMTSPRIAPQIAGVGLIDAIAESDILRNAAEQSALPGAIKGRPNRVWDAVAGQQRIGRFGWKANVATLAHQTAAAFVGDIGITSRTFAGESCTPHQADCIAAPHGGEAGQPEIDDITFGHVVFYQSTLAPAARRNVQDAQVRRGQQLFAQSQCAACHRPSYLTGAGPFLALTSGAVSGQRIWPYTDLLLHDMGPDLADGRPDFAANGRQWKTPPLWGIGLIRDVNGHQRLLHDGRADGVLEAILWHGGEAEAAKRAVRKLSAADRQALVKFVESL